MRNLLNEEGTQPVQNCSDAQLPLQPNTKSESQTESQSLNEFVKYLPLVPFDAFIYLFRLVTIKVYFSPSKTLHTTRALLTKQPCGNSALPTWMNTFTISTRSSVNGCTWNPSLVEGHCHRNKDDLDEWMMTTSKS